MVDKVNGGVSAGQNLVGHLSYYIVVSAGATFTGDEGVPNSELEVVYETVSLRSTPVVISVANDTTLHMAIENAGDGWVDADLDAALEAALGRADVTVTAGSFAVV